MKIVTNSILAAVLVVCMSGTAYAQSGSATPGDPSGANGAGTGTGLGTGAAGTGLSGGPARGTTAIGGGVGTGSGAPAANNMRANGTSLNMNPDPRAPNVGGNAFAPPR